MLQSSFMPKLNPNDIMQMIGQQGEVPQDQSALVDQMTGAGQMPMQNPMSTGSYDQGEPMTLASMNGMPTDLIMKILDIIYGNNQSQSPGFSPAAEENNEVDQAIQGMMQQQAMQQGMPQQVPPQQGSAPMNVPPEAMQQGDQIDPQMLMMLMQQAGGGSYPYENE